MITPTFKVEQDANYVYLYITAPFAKVIINLKSFKSGVLIVLFEVK